MKIFEIINNVHSIRVGNDDFAILLPIEYGGCENHVVLMNTCETDDCRIKRNYDFLCSFKVSENKDVFIYNINGENHDREKLDSGEYDVYCHIDYYNDDYKFIFLKRKIFN